MVMEKVESQFAFYLLGVLVKHVILTIVRMTLLDSFFKTQKNIRESFRTVNQMFEAYPISFYSNIPNSNYLTFLPAIFYGSVTTFYLFGKINTKIFIGANISCILLCIIFSLGIYLNWRIGLKKYEAFG